MFKDCKELANKVVDTISAPVNAFDETMRSNPDLIVPLAVVHASLCAMSILGTVAVIRGHQQVKIEKLKTKQIKMQAFIKLHEAGGHHCHGMHHGHHQHHDPSRMLTHGETRRQAKG